MQINDIICVLWFVYLIEMIHLWHHFNFVNLRLVSSIGLLYWSPLLVSSIGLRDWSPLLVSSIGLLDWSPRLVSSIGLLYWSPLLGSLIGSLYNDPIIVSMKWSLVNALGMRYRVILSNEINIIFCAIV